MLSSDKKSVQRKSILIIDDDPEMCKLLEKVLDRENYRVQAAYSGDDAILLLKQKSFHLIISDLTMPGMSGIELTRQAKAISPETHIILITAFGNMDTYLEAMNAGTYEFINKPIKMKDLKRIIKKALLEKRPKLHLQKGPLTADRSAR